MVTVTDLVSRPVLQPEMATATVTGMGKVMQVEFAEKPAIAPELH
jgi:hypothetical protein